MKMYLNGAWVDRDERLEVVNPFDLSVVDTVPVATVDDVDLAVKSASKARAAMAALSGYERFEILREAARRLKEETESLATLISREEGKTIGEATAEIAIIGSMDSTMPGSRMVSL